jgi:uncharacterized membrane protein YebE (DUF533 family)
VDIVTAVAVVVFLVAVGYVRYEVWRLERRFRKAQRKVPAQLRREVEQAVHSGRAFAVSIIDDHIKAARAAGSHDGDVVVEMLSRVRQNITDATLVVR